MKTRFITRTIGLVVLLLAASNILFKQAVYGQRDTEIECGSRPIENSFINNGESHLYLIKMDLRDSIEVSVEPASPYLQTSVGVYGTNGGGLVLSGNVQPRPKITTDLLPLPGIYKIIVANGTLNAEGANTSWTMGGVGVYTLYVTCTKNDGEVIKPGDTPQPTPTRSPLPTPTVRAAQPEVKPEFAGIGFPGLNPVDFADAIFVSLNSGQTTKASMALNNQILGFTLEAEAGDVLDLTYKRLKGNMNLGMVVLSADNQVFFQASLVTSESLATRFTLPTAGEYTIGVFRIALVEPEKVEKTEFELTATLNLEK